LGEVIDGCFAYIDNEDILIEELVHHIKAPDFPTKATITNINDMLEMYKTGKEQKELRAKYNIEYEDDKKQIVFTEIPYQTNKAKICASIVELINKKLEGFKNILDVRDETDREGMRIVVELKKTENEDVILALLLQKTQLQKSFSAEFLALVDGEPKLLNLKEIIKHYINFQKEIITRRSKFDLNKSEARLHVLEGLKIALDNLDNIISVIRNSKTSENA
jgi:DNA gyrase subunit A